MFGLARVIQTWLCLLRNWKQQICRWQRQRKTQWCGRSKRWCWRGVCSWQLARQDTGTWSTDSENGWNIIVLCAKLPGKRFKQSAFEANVYTTNYKLLLVYEIQVQLDVINLEFWELEVPGVFSSKLIDFCTSEELLF